MQPRISAFHGKALPQTHEDCPPYHILRGIRHHESFARSAEVRDFCSEPGHERYARARNARLIMSNTVPEMLSESVKPYCIWYPDTATEETYRELARRHPEMRYHVGRACAVAGYKTLYDELNLLPDVSIAEEARDNGNTDIFEAITKQPVRYAVMDDYKRTVNLESPKAGVNLNGDTAVRSSIHSEPLEDDENPGQFTYRFTHFDIQEDEHVGFKGWPSPGVSILDSKYAYLAYSPLPRDLPPVNKDVLILMAAWDGNIERYSRLRRPFTIDNEISAVIRGVYHHTTFARWLDVCMGEIFPSSELDWAEHYMRQAIHARFIMNNDLSRIDGSVDGDELPALFWWPECPHEDTLRELAWRRPDFKHQVTLACVAANYPFLFDELSTDMKPTRQQWEVAIQSPNMYFREKLKKREEREGEINFNYDKNYFHPTPTRSYPWPDDEFWSRKYLRWNKEMPRGFRVSKYYHELFNKPDEGHFENFDDPEPDLLNDTLQELFKDWNLFISATDKAREDAAASKKREFLYGEPEDIERRKSPAPEPDYPKDFEPYDEWAK
ncbi:uncharacterized protein CTRU02_200624 [Colletotrichum truncatum]|uniref:Uncharacterized protein n=1 Tax=Colletotrichum truncatum TaxID=5467 RepID=A0ACC3ZFP1_COLTU|nr:uncharacterized protein CTRU02_00387 [Colletotrichum truncatum]KAF6801638.1 hypothetical protein CTRU02_00387 [Colletotrichum truncatum]